MSRFREHWQAVSFGLLFLVLSGYRYGFSNAHEGNQLARRLMDPQYLTHDWYTNTVSTTSVRMASSWVLSKLGLLFGIEGASWWLYALFAVLMGMSLYYLARTLFPHPSLALLLILVIHIPAPGEAHLWLETLEAQTFAVPFAFFGLTLALRERWRLAGLCFGFATLFHHLIGLEFFFLAFVGAFILNRRRAWIEGLLYFLPVGGVNLFFLGLNLLQHRAPMRQALEILTVYRNPWHYLPFVGPHVGFLGDFALLVLLGGACWWPFRKESNHRAVGGWAVTILLLMVLAIPLTIWPLPLFIKFQFYRLAPFVQLLVYLYAGALLEIGLRKLFPWPRLDWLMIPVVLLAILSLVDAQASLGGKHFLPRSAQRYQIRVQELTQDDWLDVCAWIREHTKPDALFLTQPDPEGFRTFAERATVVDFKNFVFMDDEMIEWHRRMVDVTGIATFSPRVWDRWAQVGAAFKGLSAERIKALRKQYGANYLLTEGDGLPFRECYRNTRYRVYALP